jgi:hypothetical protein
MGRAKNGFWARSMASMPSIMGGCWPTPQSDRSRLLGSGERLAPTALRPTSAGAARHQALRPQRLYRKTERLAYGARWGLVCLWLERQKGAGQSPLELRLARRCSTRVNVVGRASAESGPDYVLASTATVEFLVLYGVKGVVERYWTEYGRLAVGCHPRV